MTTDRQNRPIHIVWCEQRQAMNINYFNSISSYSQFYSHCLRWWNACVHFNPSSSLYIHIFLLLSWHLEYRTFSEFHFSKWISNKIRSVQHLPVVIDLPIQFITHEPYQIISIYLVYRFTKLSENIWIFRNFRFDNSWVDSILWLILIWVRSKCEEYVSPIYPFEWK